MKERAETDPLNIEPDWDDLVKGLENKNISDICAKLIIYGIDTNKPIPPGTILGKLTGEQNNSLNKLPLNTSVSPDKVLENVKSELGEKTAVKVQKVLGKKFSGNRKINKLKFGSSKAQKLKYGSIKGIHGKWRRKASGGTWTIYTDKKKSKVLKAPHAGDNPWEGALLASTHEEVAETIERECKNKPLGPPKNHDIIVTEVEGAKAALVVADYEKNYVTSNSRDGVKKVQQILRKMFEHGQIPAHEFDYDQQGLERRNLAYRNGEFIALDLCDKEVLNQKDFLRENGIIEKAEKLGFKQNSSSSFLGSLFDRF